MFVQILNEAGYEEALMGLALSFYDHKQPLVDFTDFVDLESSRRPEIGGNPFFWTDTKFERMKKLSIILAHKKPNEDRSDIRNNETYIQAEKKFMESIAIWIFIQASRDFWSEFDTYRNMTKQSSSTMHTLDKRPVDKDDFEDGVSILAIQAFNLKLEEYKDSESPNFKDVSILKKNLPEGWLQERQIMTSYKELQWIIKQREGHRLREWGVFVDSIKSQIEHPELIWEMN